nr:hypothetical protein Itr_chr12CG00750 [Ipomoea trifida]
MVDVYSYHQVVDHLGKVLGMTEMTVFLSHQKSHFGQGCPCQNATGGTSGLDAEVCEGKEDFPESLSVSGKPCAVPSSLTQKMLVFQTHIQMVLEMNRFQEVHHAQESAKTAGVDFHGA